MGYTKLLNSRLSYYKMSVDIRMYLSSAGISSSKFFRYIPILFCSFKSKQHNNNNTKRNTFYLKISGIT